MPRSALITGAAGQDGRYLTDLLVGKGYRVYGVVGPAPGDYARWAADRADALVPVEADLSDSASVDLTVRGTHPDEVYNLGGLSSVAGSWERPDLYADINGRGVVRLLEAVREHVPSAAFVQASSAEIFGDPPRSPQDEATPIAPTNPYGESKAVAHRAVREARASGLRASNAILYNHESPLRPLTFVTAKIADGAARVKAGLAAELRLGNLDVVRDWGFAGDYVEAMSLIASEPLADDFVVATGVAHTVRDFARAAFAAVGLDYREYVVVDPALVRAADATALVGDATHIREALGWAPRVGFERLVSMMVEAAEQRLALP